jgi:hypothetical protein
MYSFQNTFMNTLKHSFFAPLLMAATLACVSASAQTPDTATLTGTVQDTTHAAVAGAAVSVTNQLTGLQRATHTSALGEFSLTGLPIGAAYNIEVIQAGFAPASLKRIVLAAPPA